MLLLRVLKAMLGNAANPNILLFLPPPPLPPSRHHHTFGLASSELTSGGPDVQTGGSYCGIMATGQHVAEYTRHGPIKREI